MSAPCGYPTTPTFSKDCDSCTENPVFAFDEDNVLTMTCPEGYFIELTNSFYVSSASARH